MGLTVDVDPSQRVAGGRCQLVEQRFQAARQLPLGVVGRTPTSSGSGHASSVITK